MFGDDLNAKTMLKDFFEEVFNSKDKVPITVGPHAVADSFVALSTAIRATMTHAGYSSSAEMPSKDEILRIAYRLAKERAGAQIMTNMFKSMGIDLDL